MDLAIIGEADIAERNAHEHAKQPKTKMLLKWCELHFMYHSMKSETTTALPKNSAVATRLAGARRETPLKPWPEVHPPPVCVPKPTNTAQAAA